LAAIFSVESFFPYVHICTTLSKKALHLHPAQSSLMFLLYYPYIEKPSAPVTLHQHISQGCTCLASSGIMDFFINTTFFPSNFCTFRLEYAFLYCL